MGSENTTQKNAVGKLTYYNTLAPSMDCSIMS
jgi:hypothetical protein